MRPANATAVALRFALILALLLGAGPAQAAESSRFARTSERPVRGAAKQPVQNELSLIGLGLDFSPDEDRSDLQRFIDERTDEELSRLELAASLFVAPHDGVVRDSRSIGRAQAFSTLHRALDGVSDADMASGAARERIAANFSRLLEEQERSSSEIARVVAPALKPVAAAPSLGSGLRRDDDATAANDAGSTVVPEPPSKLRQWKDLDSSFHQFLYGESLATGASIAMAIVIPAYAMAHFGIAVGVAGQLINIGARVVGSRWAASRVARLASRGLTEKTLYIANAMIQVSNTGVFVLGFFLLGAEHWAYAGLFLANQVVHGLSNGSIDNMASGSIKPRMLGREESILQRANFLSQSMRAGASLAAGLLVSDVLNGWVRPELQIMIFAGLQLATIHFFRKIRFRPDAVAEPGGSPSRIVATPGPPLEWRDYLPAIASQFATTTFWTLFTSAFAVYVFGGAAFNGWSITLHLAGSALASGALALLPKRITDRLPLALAFAMLVAAQGALLYTGFTAAPWMYLPAAFVLGATIDLNKGRANALFQSRLPQSEIGALTARLGKWGMGLAVPLLIFIGTAKILGGDVLAILGWAALATFGVQATLFALSFTRRRGGT